MLLIFVDDKVILRVNQLITIRSSHNFTQFWP